MFGLFKRNKEPSWSVVVVPRGEHKVQDVEAKLYGPDGSFAGKLWQDRWSHGEGRFRVQVRKLPTAYKGRRSSIAMASRYHYSRFPAVRSTSSGADR